MYCFRNYISSLKACAGHRQQNCLLFLKAVFTLMLIVLLLNSTPVTLEWARPYWYRPCVVVANLCRAVHGNQPTHSSSYKLWATLGRQLLRSPLSMKRMIQLCTARTLVLCVLTTKLDSDPTDSQAASLCRVGIHAYL